MYAMKNLNTALAPSACQVLHPNQWVKLIQADLETSIYCNILQYTLYIRLRMTSH